MKKYIEVKNEQQEQLNDFLKDTAFFAFNREQWDKGLTKLGLTKDTMSDKLTSLGKGSGDYLLRTKCKDYIQLLKDQSIQLDDLLTNHEFLLDALKYELSNHEYCYTHDFTNALGSLGLDESYFDTEVKMTILSQALVACRGEG